MFYRTLPSLATDGISFFRHRAHGAYSGGLTLIWRDVRGICDSLK